jgi:O6-methylguanine-DNA--protein-cysteine methyltransferase
MLFKLAELVGPPQVSLGVRSQGNSFTEIVIKILSSISCGTSTGCSGVAKAFIRLVKSSAASLAVASGRNDGY